MGNIPCLGLDLAAQNQGSYSWFCLGIGSQGTCHQWTDTLRSLFDTTLYHTLQFQIPGIRSRSRNSLHHVLVLIYVGARVISTLRGLTLSSDSLKRLANEVVGLSEASRATLRVISLKAWLHWYQVPRNPDSITNNSLGPDFIRPPANLSEYIIC